MLYGKELAQSIQKRCKIQPGNLVKSSLGTEITKVALVLGMSPACEFDRDYEEAEEHIFYRCLPIDGSQEFVDYVCNMELVS